ncbi:Protein lin-7 like protein C [Atta colombica]|uniref:Protein lin-7 like protein C n=1 Tax=Atta colombica TaxID=520822 RepID=A0A151I3U4_9HYME|nr:PREDICTED: uncharacterized protein LOC108686261 isoform X2 [Atta colombica]KYM84041.1 Protein lin-7 like protein C [Atta colombica]
MATMGEPLTLARDIKRSIELLDKLQKGGEVPTTKLAALQKVLQSDFLSAVREVYEHVYETVDIQRVITSGVHPRKEDEQAVNVPNGVNQLLIRDHPEAATDRDEIHCGQYGKYLKNQSRKHLLAGQMLNFLEEPKSSTQCIFNKWVFSNTVSYTKCSNYDTLLHYSTK